MEFQIGDLIRYKDFPLQMGTTVRLNPLGVKKAIVVKMNEGPMYRCDNIVAYFSASVDDLEKCP